MHALRPATVARSAARRTSRRSSRCPRVSALRAARKVPPVRVCASRSARPPRALRNWPRDRCAMAARSAPALQFHAARSRTRRSQYPSATPRLRSAVESERSRCHRDTGSLSARCDMIAFASPRLPSEFSKSIGLTLCGIVDEPVSPSTRAAARSSRWRCSPKCRDRNRATPD